MKDDIKLRETFDQEAELYNAIRPTYPGALFDALVEATNLPSKAKLVEIGPGTGQATRPLADRGYDITAVELGIGLADVARQELRRYPNVKVITGSFEDTELPANSFNLVFAATAFHWIKPEMRFSKPHRILKRGGHLAIIHTNHVSDEQGDQLFNASQPIYHKYYGNDGSSKPTLPAAADVQPTELDDKFFKLTLFACFPMIVDYTADEYANLLNTYSPTLALPKDKRLDFIRDIKAIINERFDGKVAKHFVMSLTVAEPVNPKIAK